MVVTAKTIQIPLHGRVQLLGDKSLTHRYILLASLLPTTVELENWLPCSDCWATVQVMRALGVNITLDAFNLLVSGVGLRGFTKPQQELYCANSGTTMRLVAGVLAAQKFSSILTGDQSLNQRPMARIAKPLNLMGAKVTTTNGCAPIYISGANLKAIDYVITPASAQVKSALQFASLYVPQAGNIATEIPVREHTTVMLQHFQQMLGAKNLEPIKITIPGDISTAAFFIVAATLVPGSKIELEGIALSTERLEFIRILQRMGVRITVNHTGYLQGESVGNIYVSAASKLNAVTVTKNSSALALDELPVLAIAASQAYGVTKFLGVEELKVKESNRLQAIVNNLQRQGITATATEYSLTIIGGNKLCGGLWDSYEDHRIAMAGLVASLVASKPVIVNGGEYVKVSSPNFLKVAKKIGWQPYCS